MTDLYDGLRPTEIGGYIELDAYRLPMRHEGAIALNCGRNALAYLIEARGIRKIALPYFLCDSMSGLCERRGVRIRRYHVGMDFLPIDLRAEDDEYLFIVNYYGQLSREVRLRLARENPRVIMDNTQAYFTEPVAHTDTLYSCRKYFGVSDGAFLYTDARIKRTLPTDESFERIGYILGRYERDAGTFFREAQQNNAFFENEPIRQMSKLTQNLLHGIDYAYVRDCRTQNFAILSDGLSCVNALRLCVPEGAFMYPLMIENAQVVKRYLLERKIYIPTLWPNVLADTPTDWTDYHLAADVLPIPCDQRYGAGEMRYLIQEIRKGMECASREEQNRS